MLSVDIEERNIDNKIVYLLDSGKTAICLENVIDVELVKKVGGLKPEAVIFKDSGFVDENSKANALQELKKQGINELRIKSI